VDLLAAAGLRLDDDSPIDRGVQYHPGPGDAAASELAAYSHGSADRADLQLFALHGVNSLCVSRKARHSPARSRRRPGATPRQTFWKITVPQTLPGIAAGCLLVFITTLGDFVVPTLLGGASSMNIARLIYNQFLGPTRAWGFGSALSMVLVLAVSLAIALLLKYGDKSSMSETSQ
jgi:hypothetical protein